MLMTEKECTICHKVKSLDDFGVNLRGLGGKRSQCRVCIGAYNSKYSKERLARDPEFREKKNSAAIQWAQNNPEKRSAIAIRRNEKELSVSPEKVRARALVNQRVRFGRTLRASDCACSECGKQAAHYHHHNGYSFEFRYDVVPVCAECHKRLD